MNRWAAFTVFLILFLGAAYLADSFFLPEVGQSPTGFWGLLILGITFLIVLVASDKASGKDIVGAI